ncbi:hypothetical protein AGMMS50293_02580 [Spirochaetia bacterium]|nr:hypothetical protein AGMMS50293_02580 [Spirochaetia bacterium]
MAFIWDPVKEAANFRKHHIHFLTAEYAFDDPCRIRRRDDDSSITEDRYQLIGMAHRALVVVYTEEGEDDTRILSARVAEPFERRIYHGGTGTAYPYGWERVEP